MHPYEFRSSNGHKQPPRRSAVNRKRNDLMHSYPDRSVHSLLRRTIYHGESGLDILRPVLVVALAFWFTREEQSLTVIQSILLGLIALNSIAGIVTVFSPSCSFLRMLKFAGDVFALGPLLALTGGVSSPFLWLAPLLLLSISLTLPWEAQAVYVPLLLASLAFGLSSAPGRIPTFDLVVILILAGGFALAANWTRQLYERERMQSSKVAEAQSELAETREELLRTAASLQKLETSSDIFQRAAASLLRLVPADSLSFYITNPKDNILVPVHAVGQDAEEVLAYPFPLTEGITGSVAQSGTAEIVNNAEVDPRSVRIPGTPEEPEALMAVPLTDGERVVAVLCLYRLGGATFRDTELATARLFASQAEVALMNVSLLRESRRRSQLLATLLELGRQITSSLEIEQISETIYHQTTEVLEADIFFIALVEDKHELVNYLLVKDTEGVQRDIHRQLKGTLAQQAMDNNAALIAQKEKIVASVDDFAGMSDVEVAIVAPVHVRGRVVGSIGALSRDRAAYDDETVRALEIIARQTGVALQNAYLFRETQKALEELEKTQEELIEGEKLRVLGEMAHTISHEFNNLLATVLGRTEMLLRQEIDGETKEQLERIRERAMHGAELVKKMRSASTPESPSEAKAVSLKNMMEGLLGKSYPSDEEATWSVVTDAEGDDVSIPAKVLEHVFEQLLNSVRAVMPRGGTLTLRAADDEEDGWSLRLVAEPRADAPEEQTSSILPSAQNNTRLSVRRARSILNDVDGELVIEKPGDGTVAFVIRIPSLESKPVGRARLRILVVDDEDSVRAVMVDMVDLLGHQADGVAGGIEALTMLERGTYDVVLSDVGMPEMDGSELVARIKEKWVDTPVILVSGWGLEECEEIALAFEGVWVLEKPVQIPVLEQTLATITRHMKES